MQMVETGGYNRILTLHGITMIFLFIIPSVPAVFGNFFLPIMIGANDVYFPRLNLASWYFYIVGAVFALVSVGLGGPDTGWTFYVPYSSTTDANVFFPIMAQWKAMVADTVVLPTPPLPMQVMIFLSQMTVSRSFILLYVPPGLPARSLWPCIPIICQWSPDRRTP